MSISIISNTGGLSMAKTDELMKKLFKHKEIFADLFNATLFNGKQIIKAEKLAELNTENIHVDESISSDVNPSILKRYRDLCMRQDDSVLQIILGCENQSEIDYSMPIRTMLYDALKYTEQQNNLELRKRKNGTYYHSKLRKDDKVLPVLTLIFYYGDKEWTAGKCIHDLIKWPEEPEIKSIVPNYKLNLLWAYQINNIDKYKSDLQYILSMLKYKEEEKSLKQYISDNNDKIQNMNQDSHNVAVALLNQNLPKLIDNQKGDFRMGENALQAIYDRGVNQGEVLHLIMQINKKILNNKNLDTIANELEEKKEDILPIYTIIKEHPDKSKEQIYAILKKES